MLVGVCKLFALEVVSDNYFILRRKIGEFWFEVELFLQYMLIINESNLSSG